MTARSPDDRDHTYVDEQGPKTNMTETPRTAESTSNPPPAKKSKARKTSTVPTRIYSYGCFPPITEAPRVEDQFRLAAQYRNALVAIEHQLRDQLRAVQLKHKRIGPALRMVEDMQAYVDDVYDDLRAAKSGTATPQLDVHREQLAMAKELRSRAFDDLREAKRDAAEDADLLAAYENARNEAHVQRKKARNDYSARGLRHGAYVRIENAIQQAASSTKKPLRFDRYDGTGSIGTQLTVTGSSVRKAADPDAIGIGMTWRELLSAADPRLRIGGPGAQDSHPRPEVAACTSWDETRKLGRNLQRHAARTWIDLRVGSNPDRSPIFARFPLILHRLPPKDAVIKWAYIVRKRIGYRYQWQLQLTLESKTFERPPIAIGTGVCAVNLGWRRLLDDENSVVGLRAGYVVDDQGIEREVRVPDYIPAHGEVRSQPILASLAKCDDLGSIRDKALERIQLTLSAWLAERKGVPAQWEITEPARSDGSIPKVMSERLRGYSAWRAAWKLRNFVDAWKTRRVEGDEQIFAAITAWAKQDRHLEIWQASQRDRTIAHRREMWRVIATQIARQYATILVGKSKLTDIEGWEQASPEDGDPSDGREQRRMARIAAPGELLAEIIKAAAKTGAEVKRVDEAKATRTCHVCGHDEPWDAKPQIDHTCENCGQTWDQDANHCRNLLKREGGASGDVVRVDGQALAESKRMKMQRTAGSSVVAQLAKQR